MHGLINRAVQCFVRDTYGSEVWSHLAELADVPEEGFEAMFVYEDETTWRMLTAIETVLNRPQESMLEDLGTYLVSSPDLDALRRLLRFGGETFIDFVHSIDELPRRAALAVPDLELPCLHVTESGDGTVRIAVQSDRAAFGHVLVGILRTLADEYGALVLMDHEGTQGDREIVCVRILSTEYAEARPFQLATPN
jgi:hypothetical protein